MDCGSGALLEFVKSVAWLEWAKATFDLLKGVAWPLAVFLIVWIFRKQFRERIPFTLSVGPTGAVFQAPAQQTQVKPATGLTNVQHPLVTVQALIGRITVEVENLPEADRIPKLMSALAEAQIERDFEFIWGLVFGSQIDALRKLKEIPSISVDEAIEFYETTVKVANKDVFATWDFGDWAKFPLTQGLIKLENGKYSITDYGRDFLAFADLRRQGVVKSL